MAFNLSKNDGVPVKRKPYWMLILLALLIGAAALYFNNSKKDVIEQPPAISTVVDTPVIQHNTESSSVDAPIPDKVAASFEKGSASAISISDSLVSSILASRSSTISVYGYASSEGDLAVNMEISRLRAEAIKQHLISKGVDANKIIATGKGIEDPIASNDTEEGRRLNRRVEILIQ